MDKSMRKHGQVNPIMVRRVGLSHRYRIIDGLARMQSLRRVGQSSILAMIYGEDFKREDELVHDIPISQIKCERDEEAQVHFQLPVKYIRTSRKDMARCMRRLLERKAEAAIEDIATKTNRSVAWIKRLLRENPA